MQSCPDKNTLNRFQRGEPLESRQLQAVAEHLSACESCSKSFEQSLSDANWIASGSTPPRVDNATKKAVTEIDAPQISASQELEHWPPPDFLESHPKWKILELLGSGGMGAVYLAQQRDSQKQLVAIKTIRGGYAASHELLQRFRREIEIMQKLGDHPNLVKIIEIDEVHSQLLLVVEYVEGRLLSELLKTASGGRLPWQEATDLMLQVLIGLDYVWEKHRLVHRDIKPNNLILMPNGTVKILDFGLAKVQAPIQNHSLTLPAVSAGTPAYCAPEQDQDFKQADFRADLYSVGCTLFELISGSKVFGPETGHHTMLAVRMAHHRETPRRLRKATSNTPRQLEVVVRRLLEKHSRRRFSTYDSVIKRLLGFASEQGVRRVLRAKPHLAPYAKKHNLLAPQTPARTTPPKHMAKKSAWFLGTTALLALSTWTIFLPANGTLKIVVDDPRVTITVDGRSVQAAESEIDPRGDRFEITLMLPAGDSDIVIQKNDASERERHRVTITANSISEIIVRLRQTNSATSREEPAEKAGTQDRTARLLVSSGRWEIEGTTLCHLDGNGEQWLVFGDPDWTDYDYSFEARHLGFPSGFSALFRCPVDEQVTLFSFGWIDLYIAQIRKRVGDEFFLPVLGPDGPYYKRLDWKSEADRWYRVVVQVRGEKANCLIDGEEIFQVTELPFATGRVGVRMWRTWEGKSEFKNFKVVAAGGQVLWEGLPALPEP